VKDPAPSVVKTLSDVTTHRSADRLFHTAGAAKVKDPAPSVGYNMSLVETPSSMLLF